MRMRVRAGVFLACVVLCACSDSDDPGTTQGGVEAGAGGAAGGTGSNAGASGSSAGRGGGAAAGGAGSGASCREREQLASAAVVDALQAADLSCSSRSDCELISIDTACHAACGWLVSRSAKASVQAVIDAQNEGICEGFEDDGCMRVIPPCVPPQDYDCVQGRCESLTGPLRPEDAGSESDAQADAGSQPGAGGDAGQGACVDREVSWGNNGGRVAYLDVHTLAPCSTFTTERMALGDPGSGASCENEVAANAGVTVDEINAALAHADVQAALPVAPILYGSDPRALDGFLFRIEFGSAVIDLGEACTPGPLCIPVPAGLEALRSLLQALAAQQRALPDCNALP